MLARTSHNPARRAHLCLVVLGIMTWVGSQSAYAQARFGNDGPVAHGNNEDGIQPNSVSVTATIGALSPFLGVDPLPRPGPGGGDGVIPPISAPDLLALDALSLMTLPNSERLRLAPLPSDGRDVFIGDPIDFGDVSFNSPTLRGGGGAPIPEPSSAALFILAAVAFTRRRRR